MSSRSWAAFLLLGGVWGSSFLWIKIGLQELGPFTLVAYRLLFGILGMAAVALLMRPVFPRRRKAWVALAIMGITNTALPFTLISWGQLTVESSVASILNSTVPLWALMIAPQFLSDERVTPASVIGLLLGFGGVVLILQRDLNGAWASGTLVGSIAILGAAVLYAGSAVFARRFLDGMNHIVQALVPIFVADSVLWPLAALNESPVVLPAQSHTWIALLWLGLLGSCLAYLLYYYLLHDIGPTRTTMVTYLFPVVGITLGVVFLGEPLDAALVLGALLVLAGIVIVNRRKGARRLVGQDGRTT